MEYLADGEAVAKDEDVDAETFTLSGIEGVEEFDAVEVKSGTTVKTFSVSCPAVAPVTTIAGEPEDEADTEGSDDETETKAERTDDETKAEDTGDETDDGAEVAGDDEGDDHRWASAGVNGHGEEDERHDGRHEMWGGTGDDDAEEESEHSDDAEESDDQDEDVEEEVDDSDAGDDEDDDEDDES